jgi:putative phosphonate transport system ATP-binding protein
VRLLVENNNWVLKLENLEKRFGEGCPECLEKEKRKLKKNYCQSCGTVYAIQDISFDLYEGEILGVVGESGSGKSTLMQSLYFDKDISNGSYYLKTYENGTKNLFECSDQAKRSIKNEHLGKVYQNPLLGLKMNFSAISNIAEKMISAGNKNVRNMMDRASFLLEHVNIPTHRMKEDPRNFSGGMQQRVQIAKALSNNPPILLLDEVTTGLDLSVQAKVLDLIKQIQREFKVTMILVSHDLSVIRMLADRTIVMLDGRIIERGLTDQILEDPQHRYTQELVHSLL